MINKERRAGVLLAVSSLPGSFGVGDFGKDAFEFIDMLDASRAKYWQILPLNPVGYGNSPYQTFSSFAGDEIYISIEKLYAELNLSLTIDVLETESVDYASSREQKNKYLREAFKFFTKDDEYEAFIKEAFWLEEYAKFMALRSVNDNRSWLEWDVFEYSDTEIEYQYFLQYHFYKQWMDIKDYANNLGIKIMGDIPIYLGHDSHEVYFNRELFHLDRDGRPTLVAGVPPDYFSEDGQLWGNPIYDWEVHKQSNYDFWVKRLEWNQRLFDTIRIDHFRAFDTYWAIPGDAKTAKTGEWIIGPRHDFFDVIYDRIKDLELVVEDLGDLRDEVLELRDDYGLMGMQIIQFALKPEEIERDIHMPENILAYTGTHDNQPIGGWVEDHDLDYQQRVRSNIENRGIHEENMVDLVCHYAMSLNANLVILPAQDLMRLGNASQMNRPGTVGSPNWEWKLKHLDDLSDGISRFKRWVIKTNRTNVS